MNNMNGEWLYYRWQNRLSNYLGKEVFGIKEYKDAIEYKGIFYNKADLLKYE